MEHDECSAMRFERHETFGGVRRGVEYLGDGGVAFVIQPRASLDGNAMSAGKCPHATVFGGGVVDGHPKTDDGGGFRPQVGVVGVAIHLATNPRLFEDVHRLQQEGIAHPQVSGHCSHSWCATEGVKDRIEVMHRVAELVQAEMRFAA